MQGWVERPILSYIMTKEEALRRFKRDCGDATHIAYTDWYIQKSKARGLYDGKAVLIYGVWIDIEELKNIGIEFHPPADRIKMKDFSINVEKKIRYLEEVVEEKKRLEQEEKLKIERETKLKELQLKRESLLVPDVIKVTKEEWIEEEPKVTWSEEDLVPTLEEMYEQERKIKTKLRQFFERLTT